MKCPKCSDDCSRESVDVGVGVINGPFGCPSCGWSEFPEYDLSDGQSNKTGDGFIKDQWGGIIREKSFFTTTNQ
jgi:hypothetical protein